ncbi:MAG: ATP-binding protein [Planctomycetes bacterium]|nr:ATP-binding protein [Planctomycetota bacterium]
MGFETSTPVVGEQFFNRVRELDMLRSIAAEAKGGVRRWLAILGHRKVGKTSLLIEFLRRSGAELPMPYVDCWDVRADPLLFLLRFLSAILGAAVRHLGAESDVGPLEAMEGDRLAASTVQALARLRSKAIDEAVQLHESVASGRPAAGTLHRIFDLPGRLAADIKGPVLVILDEFQELERLRRLRRFKDRVDDVFGLLRSLWQRQEGVSYVVAGSRLSAMRQIIADEKDAFFQHFEVLELGPFERRESLEMLRDAFGAGADLAKSAMATRILDLVGDHPFYVRVVAGEAAAALPGGRVTLHVLEHAMKEALESSLLEENGRLSLFMEQRYRAVTGESSTLESVLRGFVDPARISEVSEKLHVRTGAVSSAVKTLLGEDVLEKHADGSYGFTDPAFALWLKHRVDFRLAMPPLLVGTDSEQAVARRLAADGFRGVYQSRASRGAFDLLAVHDTRVIGLQVKTGAPPFELRAQEKARLLEDARRLGFVPALALVRGDAVRFYDLRQGSGKGGLRIRDDTRAVETLLELL